MSFLSGLLDIGKSFFTGGSIASSLAKTALMGFALNRLNKNTNKNSDDSKTANIDAGVRLQLPSDAAFKIPVLYGTAYFGGNLIDAQMTNSNKTMWFALVLSEKTGTTITGTASSYVFKDVYWNQQRVQFKSDGITVDYTRDRAGNIDRSLSGLVKIYQYAGSSTSGQVPESYTGTVPAAHTLFPNWTSGTHPMTNLVFALVSVDYNRDKGVRGLGDLLFQVQNSMKMPGDVLYDYMTNGVYGAKIPSADIDTATLTALNTYSDSTVTYTNRLLNGTTQSGVVLQDRYQINGLLATDQKVLDNIERVCNATASWLSYDNNEGKWGVIINRAGTSVASFNDNNILGTVSVSGTGLQDLKNSVKVEFARSELRDSADFVNIALTAGDYNANEIDNPLPLTYDIINEPVQAKLLGFIELKQSRVDKVIQFQSDFSYINLKPGDIIDVTDSRLTFSAKLFRIISISEVQEDGGALSVDITALEYDASVYALDLDRYEVSDQDGIVAIGNIGTPGTPQVTEVEKDARPRIIVESTAPTGIVEGMEFWLTTDVSVPSDDARSYRLIATTRPTGGGTYGSGTTVTLDYDSLGTANFIIKTRGINEVTVGPFSTPSGSVFFAPVQTTNAIDANTSMFDSTGGLLAGLALVQLAKKLLDLFGGDTGMSLFDKIFDVFKDETGVDLVGQASGGSLVVASNIAIKSNGSSITGTVASIDFKSGLQASASGSDVIAKLKDGVKPKDILIWDGGEWVLASGCVTCNPAVIEQADPVEDPDVCYITMSAMLPPSNHTLVLDACSTITPLVPHTGSYFMRFSSSEPFYGAIEKGSGNIEMYQTDGTLHEAVAAGSLIIHNDTVEIPFTKPRLLGTDYYITMPRGAVTYCGCPNKEILPPYGNSTTWDFTVAPYSVTPYIASNFIVPDSVEYTTVRPLVSSFATPDKSSNFALPANGTNRFKEKYVSPAHNASETDESGWVCPEKYLKDFGRDQEVKIVFDEEVVKLSGTIELIDAETGASITTRNVSSMTLENEPIYSASLKAVLGTNKIYLNDGTLNPKTSNTDKVASVQVLEGGGGYKSDSVAVSFSSPNSGQKAIGTAVLDGNGRVTGITITQPGWGYTSAPTVTITGERDYSLLPADGQSKKPAKTEAYYKNRVLNIGKVKDLGLTKGRRYVVRVPAGAVMSKRVACPNTSTYEVVNRQINWSFRLAPALALVRYQLCSLPNTNDTTYQKVNIRSNIWLYFTKNFKIKPTGPANVVIYEKNLILGDTIHQTIDLRKTFSDNKVGQLSNYFLPEQTNEITDKKDEKILKINSTKPFKPNQQYYIQVPAGVLLGAECEDAWAGVTDKTTIAWKTDGITNTQPSAPTAGTPFRREVAFEFDAPVVPGSGMLNVRDASGNVVAQISSNDPAITYSS
jgi:hypothetical protein